TTVDGCVFFVGLAPGNFDVSLNTTGFVDVQNEVNPVQLLAISAGSITSGEFVYDRSSTIDMSLVGLANYGVPGGLGGTVANTGLALGTQPFSSAGGASCNPVTVGAASDARVRQLAPTTNYGSETTMKVISQSGSGNERTFIKFNLPAVPAGCQFAVADLRLYQDTGVSGRTIQVYRSNSSWSESSITWNTQPVTAGTAVTAPSSSSPAVWMTWNVSTLVSTMYSGTNNGFVLKDSVESASSTARTQVYRSRNHGTSSTRPELVVTFSPLLPASQSVAATPLFPYLNGYQVWGGTCQDADPEGVNPSTGLAYFPGGQRAAAVASNPAQSTSVTVPLKSVDVRVQRSDTTLVSGAAVVAYHDPDNGCTSGKVLDLGWTGIDGYVRVALPYGTWRFQVTSKTPVGSWPSDLLSPTTTNPHSITVTVN
ncbi:MAG: DNRLRE domain-containing protein, partial [Actinomycetota bacterium]